jgi:hypothetical protein
MKTSGSIKRMGWLAGVVLAASALAVMPASAADLAKFSNGEVITDADFSGYVFRRADLRAAARSKWGAEKVLREMVVARALVLEGEQLQMPRPAEKAAERFDDVYAHAVFKRLSPRCDRPADAAAARKFFDENPKAFTVPPMARLTRVMLPVAEKVEGKPAPEWLMGEAKEIAAGAQKFDDVVAQADKVYKLEAQGDLGWVVIPDENAIMRAIAAAKQGDMVGPVRDGDFVYLFSVVGKRESRQLAWDEVAVSAATRAVSYCRQEAATKLESDLFTKYGVQLDSAAIGALFDRKVTN